MDKEIYRTSFYFNKIVGSVIILNVLLLLSNMLINNKDDKLFNILLLGMNFCYLLVIIFNQKVFIVTENKLIIKYPLRFFKREFQYNLSKVSNVAIVRNSKGPDLISFKYNIRDFLFINITSTLMFIKNKEKEKLETIVKNMINRKE